MATRNFFRKAPRLNPDLCKKPAKVLPQHKGKMVVVTLSDGTIRLYPSSKWAQKEGGRRGGKRTFALKSGYLFTSETAREAISKLWKRRKKMYWSGVRQGMPAHRKPKKVSPTVVAVRLHVRRPKKEIVE